MAISLPQGFIIGSKEPVDSRLTLTKAEMVATLKGGMPDNYICVCKDDGKLYIWNSAYEKSAEYGRFKPYEEVIDIPAAVAKAMSTAEGKAAMEEAIATTLPGAMKDVLEDPVLGPALVNNMFDNKQFDINVDNKISLAVSLIQAIDGN